MPMRADLPDPFHLCFPVVGAIELRGVVHVPIVYQSIFEFMDVWPRERRHSPPPCIFVVVIVDIPMEAWVQLMKEAVDAHFRCLAELRR
jgi:hypothetical protein